MTSPAQPMTSNDWMTYRTLSVGAQAAVVPTLPALNLSDEDRALVGQLETLVTSRRFAMELLDAYYQGTVRIQSLGIAIPPQMTSLRVAMGWPRVAVETLEERLHVEGFRMPGATDADPDLWDLWLANDMEAQSSLAHLDSFIFGRSYVAAGTGDDNPIITVESPLDMAVLWDARTRTVRAALRLFNFEGARQATLYKPDETITLARSTEGGWGVLDRDQHKLGTPLVERIANRQRTYNQDGVSEITPEVMSLTDQACRTLLGLEVAREFYSAPQRYILGADESAFQDAQGNAKSAWQTYLGRVLALERDEDGNLPTVGQFQAFDPSTFTKIIDMYAKMMSALTGLPPHALGYTTDNPASADAIRSSEMRLKLRADRKCSSLGSNWRNVMKLAVLARDGRPDPRMDRLSTDWRDTGTPTPAATTDAIAKQVQVGSVPAHSDVVLKRLGYSAVERAQLEQDRKEDAGAQFLAELAQSLQAREARVDKSLAADIGGPKAAAAPTIPGVTQGDGGPAAAGH